MFHNREYARTALGSPIELYASSDLEKLKKERPLLLMGGIHGDEPLGVRLAESTLDWLKKGEARVPWLLIPCLNVDGFKKGTRVNGRAVDLNRNYPSKSWAPGFEKERYNPGPGPGSEPEIQAVVKLIQEFHPRLVIHCHSWQPMIVATGAPAHKDAERLSRSSGYKVVPEIGYPTPGSLSQYGWIDHKIPIICIEEDDNTPLEKVWANFAAGMREIFLDASPR